MKKMASYSVEDLLVGKWYRSPNSRIKEGEIIHAEKTDNGWANDGCQNYLIQYKQDGSIRYQYATIEVRNA